MVAQAVERMDPKRAEAIEQQILLRTWGRIHRLRVEMVGDRAVVHGRTASYYTKQLALAAALELLDETTVELDIEVARSDPRVALARSQPVNA